MFRVFGPDPKTTRPFPATCRDFEVEISSSPSQAERYILLSRSAAFRRQRLGHEVGVGQNLSFVRWSLV